MKKALWASIAMACAACGGNVSLGGGGSGGAGSGGGPGAGPDAASGGVAGAAGGTGGSIGTDAGTGGSAVGGTAGAAGVAGTGGSAGTGSSCTLAKWPSPPTADDPGGSDVELVEAIKTIDLGYPWDSSSAFETTGFDFDGQCTSGNPPADSGICANFGGYDVADLAGGRDNAFGRLLATVSAVFNFPPPVYDATTPIADGQGSTLLRVRGWNGLANDTQVELSVFVGAPLDALGLPGGRTKPKWDGADSWPLDSASLEADGVTPKYVDPKAYVVNNTLVGVMPLADIRLLMDLGTSYLSEQALDLVDAVFVADIRKDANGRYVLSNGQMAGRVTSLSLIQQVDEWDSCSATWLAGMRRAICKKIDLAAPGAPLPTACTALSFAAGFTAGQAELGAPYDLGPVKHKCATDLIPTQDCGPN